MRACQRSAIKCHLAQILLLASLVNALQFELTGLVCLLAAPVQGQTSAPSRAHLHPAAAAVAAAAGNKHEVART